MTILTTNKYRLSGTFEYLEYCSECKPECEGHEKLFTVQRYEECGDSEKEAIKNAIDSFSLEYTDACWLYGQPMIEFVSVVMVGPRPDVKSYWTQPPIEQGKIREKVALDELLSDL